MNNMMRQLLHLHWKTVRWPLAPVILAAFGLPLFVLRIINAVGQSGTPVSPATLIQMQGEWAFVFPLLALVAGVMVALTGWSWDHQGRHVYALSLPVSRGRYSMLKFAVGLMILMLPIAALGIGTIAGIASVPVPAALHAYPVSFIARFALAAIVVFAATFAAASSTVRTTAIVLGAFIVVIVFGTVLVSFIQSALGDRSLTTPAELLYIALVRWPGPFNVFGGNWLIIDA